MRFVHPSPDAQGHARLQADGVLFTVAQMCILPPMHRDTRSTQTAFLQERFKGCILPPMHRDTRSKSSF